MTAVTKYLTLPLLAFCLLLGVLAVIALRQGDCGWALAAAFLSGAVSGVNAAILLAMSMFGGQRL